MMAEAALELRPVHCPRCRGQGTDAIVCRIDERRVRVVAADEPADVHVQCSCGGSIGLRMMAEILRPAA